MRLWIRLHLFSNMCESGKTNLEINNLVKSLDSPINAELLPAICFLEVSNFRAIVSLSRLGSFKKGLPALPPNLWDYSSSALRTMLGSFLFGRMCLAAEL